MKTMEILDGRRFRDRLTIASKKVKSIGLHKKRPINVQCFRVLEDILIDTEEGIMQAKEEDYLIIGAKGEIYSCKKDIFEITYDKVDLRE
jgi:hypothetical protein